MRHGELKKLHHHYVRLLRNINKQLLKDDWFNGRFYLHLYNMDSAHYNDEYDDYAHPTKAIFSVMAIDKLNPLNVGAHMSELIYYHAENPPESVRHEHGHLNEFLNSWIQFCESGCVFDSPSHFNYAYMIDDEAVNNIINKSDEWNATEEDKEYFKNVISNFDSSKSFIYNREDFTTVENIIYNCHVESPDKFKRTDYGYHISGLLWKYGNGIVLENSNNEFLCLFVKNGDYWYGCRFKNSSLMKPHWNNDRREYTMCAVKLGKSLLEFLSDCDKDDVFKCWLYLTTSKHQIN